MSSLDFDLDAQINHLELEWRLVYDAGIIARANYRELAANRSANAKAVEIALVTLERAESKKARIMARIERLEDSMIIQGRPRE